MNPRFKTAIPALGLLALGLLGGWWLYHGRPSPPEPPAPAIHQTDGSLILERSPSGKPADHPEDPILKPAGTLPKGAVVERNVEVIVRPAPQLNTRGSQYDKDTHLEMPNPGAPDLSAAFQCPDVKVDLSLVRMKDQTHRVIASSPDGKVIAGLDVPVSEPPSFKPQRWTAQGMVGWDTKQGRQVFGGQVSRNLGPFTLSVGAIGGTAFVGAGIHF
jgi:hypothetical protein